jgi:hypothetical protein
VYVEEDAEDFYESYGRQIVRIHRPDRFVTAWRELEEAGIPLEPKPLRASVTRNYGLTMRCRPLVFDEACIREIRLYRVAYVLPVFIRRDEPGTTIIRDCTLRAPWDDSIEWLEEDAEKNVGWYTFSEQTCPRVHEFPRVMVLNHRMTGTLRRGDIREGVLLGVGSAPIPEAYRSGEKIPITLTILDQWDCEPSATFDFQLTSCRTRVPEIPKSPSKSLLSRRDPVVPSSLPKALPMPLPKECDEKIDYEEIIRDIKPPISTMVHAVGGPNKKRER